MTLEALNLVGLFTGPIVAVVIAAVWEKVRRNRDQKLNVVRMFFNARATPGNAEYTVALNLTRIEFSKSSKVMAAWRAYMECVNKQGLANGDPNHIRDAVALQSLLLKEMMVALGYKVTEAELTTQAYVARGYMQQQERIERALEALPTIALAAERSAQASEAMLQHIQSGPGDQ